ncbi:MAG: hypothetical protein Q8Q88_06290 [Phenylobacterium sp.]|uniref:hypothetical protein n=1 Tax=Phenylobacterium sp. TaxID=1871053 RepID=UPI0027323D66|nr:hypothetical protein [Phenylobacterium sp.]MDP3746643.1 hypothetical protein [Phenylobacterium sp.]
MRILKILPAGPGCWQLTGLGEPTYFRSGRAAEATGRRLASAAAVQGPVELQVYDLSGGLAGKLRFNGAA